MSLTVQLVVQRCTVTSRGLSALSRFDKQGMCCKGGAAGPGPTPDRAAQGQRGGRGQGLAGRARGGALRIKKVGRANIARPSTERQILATPIGL
jgi:hypothetical protein